MAGVIISRLRSCNRDATESHEHPRPLTHLSPREKKDEPNIPLWLTYFVSKGLYRLEHHFL